MVLGLGSWEILLVGLALLVLFGPEHVPPMLRRLGQLQARAQNVLREMEETIERESREPVEYPELEPPEDGVIPQDRE